MLTAYVASFAASLLYVFLKATQQLNVVLNVRRWILPVSLGMGLLEVFIVGTVSITAVKVGGFWPLFGLGLSLGGGGAVGCLSAMWLHRKFIKKGG